MKKKRTVSFILASLLLFHSVAQAGSSACVCEPVMARNTRRKPALRVERKKRMYHTSRVREKDTETKKCAHKGVRRRIPEDYPVSGAEGLNHFNRTLRFFCSIGIILVTGYLMVHSNNGTETSTNPTPPPAPPASVDDHLGYLIIYGAK